MRTVDQWLREYGENHRNPTNKGLHWICVPIIVISLVGLLWCVPMPRMLREISPFLNLGTALLMAGVIYYFFMSWSLALGMLVFSAIATATVIGLDALPWSLWMVCGALFIVAWIGQFIGHRYEGKRPSFFQDLQFLMIGPLWLLSFIYRKLRIPF